MAQTTFYYPSGAIQRQWSSANGYRAWSEAGALVEQRALTPAEVAALDADDLAWAEVTNETTLRQRADAALAELRNLANSSGTLTGLQLSNGVRLLAKVVIALVKLQLRRFDTPD